MLSNVSAEQSFKVAYKLNLVRLAFPDRLPNFETTFF